MAARQSGLGKGLESLFQEVATGGEQIKESLKINIIEPDPNQPRKNFNQEELQELSASISEHGVLQPIIVRPIGIENYRLIAGERRWRAARAAGLLEIPAIIMDVPDQLAMEIALVENLQRSDLDVVEEARGYKQLMELCELTQEQAAKRVGKSRPAVANSLRLLALPDVVKEMLSKGNLTTGHAKVLLALVDEESVTNAAHKVVRHSLNVRDTEIMVKKLLKSPKLSQQKLKLRPTIASEVEIALKDVLGTEVKINYKNGKGKIEVNFYSDDQLKAFANRLGEYSLERGV